MDERIEYVGDPPQEERDCGLVCEMNEGVPVKSRGEFAVFMMAALLAIPILLCRAVHHVAVRYLFHIVPAWFYKSTYATPSISKLKDEPPTLPTPGAV